MPSWTALQSARKGLFAQTVVHALFHKHRILTQVSGDHLEVIKLIPPLIIGEARSIGSWTRSSTSWTRRTAARA